MIEDNEGKREYNVVFGSTSVDLFKMQIPTSDQRMEMNVVFGSGKLIINDSIPMRIEMNTVFGSIQAPDRNKGGFGTTHYTTSAYKEGQPSVQLETNAVFGSIQIVSKKW